MKTKTQICWWLFAVYRQSFLYLIHFNKYICHMCMYVCMRILRLYTRHKPNTLYAIFCRGRRHKEQGLSFFFHHRGWSWFFLCIHFFNFYVEGWRLTVCVCVCCVPTTEGGKNCHSARGTYILLMRHHQLHYNFVGVVFFIPSFFMFFCFCMLHFSFCCSRSTAMQYPTHISLTLRRNCSNTCIL